MHGGTGDVVGVFGDPGISGDRLPRMAGIEPDDQQSVKGQRRDAGDALDGQR